MKTFFEFIYRGIWLVLFELGFLWRVRRADERTVDLRLETCRKCPVFVARFSTCGFHYERDPESGRTIRLGCGCFMKVKSKILKATCWGRDKGLPLGWPAEINGRE